VCFGALWKVQNEAFPTVPPAGQTDKWKALKLRVKAVNAPKWAQHSQASKWESGGEVRDGAGKRVMGCEMCTDLDMEGRGWERQWQLRLQRCRTWPGMYTKERTGAVALRAALELAVQLGRGDEGNMLQQAEMANPTKCRDSLKTNRAKSRRRAVARIQPVYIQRAVAVPRRTQQPHRKRISGMPGDACA
jgi:hypothetical protein